MKVVIKGDVFEFEFEEHEMKFTVAGGNFEAAKQKLLGNISSWIDAERKNLMLREEIVFQ